MNSLEYSPNWADFHGCFRYLHEINGD